MATTITTECINCGACEPECPNTAIYAGGVNWELNGVSAPALTQDIFYIVPSKCTECVGFYDHEACAAVCPVDCCVPDPNNLENEAALLERARTLHPDQSFGADAPSRFRKAADGGAAAPPAAAAPSPAPTAAPAVTVKPVATSAPPAAALATEGDEFDPATWEVPIVCHLCSHNYPLPYLYFRVGAVFYCPACSASFVPNSTIYSAVRKTFEDYYSRRKREREAFEQRRARELDAFETKQAAEARAFQARLEALAHERTPAGKVVKPRGLAAMFS